MTWKLFFTLLIMMLTISTAMAEIDPKFVDFAKKECDFYNPEKSIGQKLNCMEDYINCTTVGAGFTDWKKLSKKCLAEAKKRAEEEDEQ